MNEVWQFGQANFFSKFYNRFADCGTQGRDASSYVLSAVTFFGCGYAAMGHIRKDFQNFF